MGRLARYTQLLFGSTAGTNEIAQYGSLAAGSPARYSGSTITPAIIQSLANYLEGWLAATEGSYSPTLEDMNALCYLYAYQIAYIMEVGLPEWDSATTYYTGQLAQDGAGTIYASITDNNTGNALSDGYNWFAFSQPGLLTPNTLPFAAGMNLPANKSLVWPNLQIGNGQNVQVSTGATLIGISNITVSGTGLLQATSTGVVRVL